ncbi:MAG: 2-C-methyl-D-erythritol 2,4-cyclodiphosphate synthase [Candidatus Aminicenantales bacterium]
MSFKVGIGYDIHRLEEGRPLYLGGVALPYPKGLKGHSDGDCLIHAVIDALLGATGSGNIGEIFPDTDPHYRDARSTDLLRKVVEDIRKAGWNIVHVDTVVIAEAPPLSPHIPRMKRTLCPLLGVRETDLGIKPKTHEGIGILGEGEAIAAMAQVLLQA